MVKSTYSRVTDTVFMYLLFGFDTFIRCLKGIDYHKKKNYHAERTFEKGRKKKNRLKSSLRTNPNSAENPTTE